MPHIFYFNTNATDPDPTTTDPDLTSTDPMQTNLNPTATDLEPMIIVPTTDLDHDIRSEFNDNRFGSNGNGSRSNDNICGSNDIEVQNEICSLYFV